MEHLLDAATPNQIERANRAVCANLDVNGTPKYESAFGYACALTAVIQSDADPRPQSLSRPSRDETWLRVAETIAQRGTCPRRRVGCVIVDAHSRVMATGYNGPASGRPHCSEGEPCPGASFRSGEGLDKCEAIHAEQNACLLLDDPWQVDTIYITASPCLSCVKLLLGTSAKRIVCREIYPHADAIDWWQRAGRELIQLSKEG